MSSETMQRFQAAAETIRQRVGEAEIGVILGSGLGDYVDALQDAKYNDYKDIPGFPVSTAPVTPDAGGQAPSTGSACA